jgi:hypothetical protein
MQSLYLYDKRARVLCVYAGSECNNICLRTLRQPTVCFISWSMNVPYTNAEPLLSATHQMLNHGYRDH